MNSLQELEVLHNNMPQYEGALPEYQLDGSNQNGKRYVDYLQEDFTAYQNLLYKRALYGLQYYDKKDLKKMHWEKKRRIKRVNKRAQDSINIFKQERVNSLCDLMYKSMFATGKDTQGVAKYFFSTEVIDTDIEFINTLDLKVLGITKGHIVERFVTEGILPKDFYEVKEAV